MLGLDQFTPAMAYSKILSNIDDTPPAVLMIPMRVKLVNGGVVVKL